MKRCPTGSWCCGEGRRVATDCHRNVANEIAVKICRRARDSLRIRIQEFRSIGTGGIVRMDYTSLRITTKTDGCRGKHSWRRTIAEVNCSADVATDRLSYR